MKTFMRSILFTGALVLGANALMGAQASSTWADQWFRAKFGRPSPAEDARKKADRANAPFRQEAAPEVAPAAANNWIEQHYRAKYGRNTPMEEARQKAERAKTAVRQKGAREGSLPANNWIEQHYRAKYGRNTPMEEARQKAARN